ncbi:MAG TPA: thioredoxin domain-containing protein [Alphaproteobacteria bacterium]|jgi:hypothetical protein|nr:thioredoxin domain-containing protein [Alphaproteobacteria bacterium]
MVNTLGSETSPYLLQHKDNPVHWQPWGEAAFAAARQADKPILLSIGYAACHWCHVMAHESFEDPTTAELMNANFINIKVDREERPDVDTIYQTALALMGEHGGWPLTMCLTPEGQPFWGGTYFPPDNRWGRPAFSQVLHALDHYYRERPDSVGRSVDQLSQALAKVSQPAGPSGPSKLGPALYDQAAGQVLRLFDPHHGGLSGAPKFPQTPMFEFLWNAYLRTGDAIFGHAVTLTLDRICQGGIYDHLGGGFARYATDEAWLVPHFEKMLYDNALLIDLLTAAWRRDQSPLYAQRVAETVAWCQREMLAESGGFAASQDADSEGEEGRFYVWQEAEIDALLGPEAEAFKAAYDVTPGGNWEGRTILNRSAAAEFGSAEHETALAAARQRLWQAREQRPKPGWDDKVLADWNGLMIAALAAAGATFERPDWLHLAGQAFIFVSEALARGDRLGHCRRGGRLTEAGFLDDYAQMARAALTLFEATGDSDLVARAEAWVAVLDSHYWDSENGGYFFTADDGENLIARPRSIVGNGTMVGVLAKLFYLTGKESYRHRAEAIVAAFAAEVGRNFAALPTLLSNSECLAAATQVVIVGEAHDAGTQALLQAAWQAPMAHRVIQQVSPGQNLPDGHPATAKVQINDRATAYVCRGPECSLPLYDAADLAAELAA